MGRLFWKFFFFFLLAQMTSIVGVSLFFWFSAHQDSQRLEREFRSGPTAMALLDAAAQTLHHGGESALQNLLQQWASKPMSQVYAVDEQGNELLHRPVPPHMLQMLDKLESHKAILKEGGADGKSLRLFVPSWPGPGQDNHPPPFLGKDKDGRPLMHGPDMLGPGMGPDHLGPPRLGSSHIGPAHMGPPPHRGPMFPWNPVWAGLIVSLIFAGLLAWYISKPIKQLSAAFQRAASGNLKDKISPVMGRRSDELADLGLGFDRMAEHLDALMQGQKRLLHYVSHEMRSPLARLQVGIGLAKQNPDKLDATLDRIEMESERMDKLLGEVLELSRLESGMMALRREKVVFRELLEGVVEDARFEASAKHIHIISAFDQDVGEPAQQENAQNAAQNAALNATLEIQPDLVYRAIENVLRNALKYSPDYSEVQLQARLEPGRVVVSILDRGAGIPETELEQIFQPFYRADSYGSVAGHGLGLAITKQVMDLHSGEIKVFNRIGGGLQVELALPFTPHATV